MGEFISYSLKGVVLVVIHVSLFYDNFNVDYATEMNDPKLLCLDSLSHFIFRYTKSCFLLKMPDVDFDLLVNS